MLQYWLAVFQKASHDSLDFIQQSRSGIAFGILVLVLTGLWLWKKHGWRDAVVHWWRTAGEGVAITLVAAIIVLLAHVIYEPFHLQYDERARTAEARQYLNSATTRSLVCEANLNGAEGKIDLLGRQVTAQQIQIAGQQTVITGAQATSATQQSTFDLCVTTLAKANAPVPWSTTLLAVGDAQPNPATKHSMRMAVLTNKAVTPVKLLFWCDGEVKTASVRPLSGAPFSGGMAKLANSGSIFSVQKIWQIDMSFPVWTPESPLFVQVDYDTDNIGTCTIKG